jgi:hypothetical protein
MSRGDGTNPPPSCKLARKLVCFIRINKYILDAIQNEPVYQIEYDIVKKAYQRNKGQS